MTWVISQYIGPHNQRPGYWCFIRPSSRCFNGNAPRFYYWNPSKRK